MITGEEIKNARKRIGMTQEQLAEYLNISLRQMSRMENDENLERYDKFLHLLVVLELYEPVKKDVWEDSEDDVKISKSKK